MSLFDKLFRRAPRPRLAADTVVLVPNGDDWDVLLILRKWEPFKGAWALPGGHVDPGETFRAAAARELAEETGVTVDPGRLFLVGVYDQPGRDPRGWYVSVTYAVVLSRRPEVAPADDAVDARWWRYAARGWVTDDGRHALTPLQLAFDHERMVRQAISKTIHGGLDAPSYRG